ncbi:MAG: hypothetical protein JST16_10785 [Bdellovibrionales bacterium]|nr:hypothetical protein [Bdellovibrionales bacterium]
MNDGLKEAYIDKMNSQLKELGARMELLKAKVSKGAANVRVDYHQQLESFEEKQSAFQKELEQVKAAAGDSFEKVKEKAQKAWGDLSNYVSENFDKATDKLSH